MNSKVHFMKFTNVYTTDLFPVGGVFPHFVPTQTEFKPEVLLSIVLVGMIISRSSKPLQKLKQIIRDEKRYE